MYNSGFGSCPTQPASIYGFRSLANTGLNTGLHRIRQFSSSLSGLDAGLVNEDVYVPRPAISFPVLCGVYIGISHHFQSAQANKKELLAKYFLLVHRISSINSMFICFRPVFLFPSDHHDYHILRLGDFYRPSNMLPLLGRGCTQNWVVVSNVFYFHPGKWSNLTSIFFQWVETTN